MTSEEFLRACLCSRNDAPAMAALSGRLLDVDGGWETVRAAIETEQIGPLLHRRLGRLGLFPAALANELERSYRTTALHNSLLLRRAGGLLRSLAGAKVPVIVLKGIALGEIVYRNIALRPMSDVDLLIRRENLERARRVLESLGYVPLRAETHPGAVAEYENAIAFRKNDRMTTTVDLHWTLFDSPYYQDQISMDWFWETARSVRIAGAHASMLGPEALLVHLCGHLALHHASAGLLRWNDIAEVIAFYGDRIDWDELLSRARELRMFAPVRAVLPRVAGEWGAPVPGATLEILQSRLPSAEEQRLFASLGAPQPPAGRRFVADLTTLGGWRRRLRFARTNLLPSPAYMRRRYRIRHPLLVPFYYPYRWARGLRGLTKSS